MNKPPAYLNYRSLIEWNTKTDVYDTCYRQMKESEKIAYKYLLNKGYTEKQISFYNTKSPDFITSDGRGWEVKTLTAQKKLCFTVNQSYMKLDTTILIVDKLGCITETLFKDVIYNPNTWFMGNYGGGHTDYNGAIKCMKHTEELNKYWETKVQLMIPNKESVIK